MSDFEYEMHNVGVDEGSREMLLMVDRVSTYDIAGIIWRIGWIVLAGIFFGLVGPRKYTDIPVNDLINESINGNRVYKLGLSGIEGAHGEVCLDAQIMENGGEVRSWDGEIVIATNKVSRYEFWNASMRAREHSQRFGVISCARPSAQNMSVEFVVRESYPSVSFTWRINNPRYMAVVALLRGAGILMNLLCYTWFKDCDDEAMEQYVTRRLIIVTLCMNNPLHLFWSVVRSPVITLIDALFYDIYVVFVAVFLIQLVASVVGDRVAVHVHVAGIIGLAVLTANSITSWLRVVEFYQRDTALPLMAVVIGLVYVVLLHIQVQSSAAKVLSPDRGRFRLYNYLADMVLVLVTGVAVITVKAPFMADSLLRDITHLGLANTITFVLVTVHVAQTSPDIRMRMETTSFHAERNVDNCET